QHFLDSVRVSQQKGKDIANTSDNVLTITTDGSKLMQESVQQMREIDHIVSSAVEQVSGLDKQSEQISKLVEVVKGIADQTKLLASFPVFNMKPMMLSYLLVRVMKK